MVGLTQKKERGLEASSKVVYYGAAVYRKTKVYGGGCSASRGSIDCRRVTVPPYRTITPFDRVVDPSCAHRQGSAVLIQQVGTATGRQAVSRLQ